MTLSLTLTVGRTEDIGAIVAALTSAAQSRRAEAEMLDRAAQQVIEQGARAAHAELAPTPVETAAAADAAPVVDPVTGGLVLSDDEVTQHLGPEGPVRPSAQASPTTTPDEAATTVDTVEVGGLLPDHVDLIPEGAEWRPPNPIPFPPPAASPEGP